MDFKTDIGNKIKQIRKLRRLSQDDLAAGVNLTRTSIVNIEKGRQGLTATTIWELCQFLKINPADIFPESKNSISILTASEIHNLKNERDEWKKKYYDLTNLLSKLKQYL